MKSLVLALLLLAPTIGLASSYYCNGNTKQSGTSWYYPNGNTAQSGTSVYYPNGNTLKSGSSLYFPNGNTLRSGTSLYYANGNTLKSGTSFYYRNGNTLKSGTSCYYENGNTMGQCPRSIDINLGVDALNAELNLDEGDIYHLSYQFSSNGTDALLVLDHNEDISDIRVTCAGSVDTDVQAVISSFKALTTEKRIQVREQICGR